jgi:hypothetical protein
MKISTKLLLALAVAALVLPAAYADAILYDRPLSSTPNGQESAGTYAYNLQDQLVPYADSFILGGDFSLDSAIYSAASYDMSSFSVWLVGDKIETPVGVDPADSTNGGHSEWDASQLQLYWGQPAFVDGDLTFQSASLETPSIVTIERAFYDATPMNYAAGPSHTDYYSVWKATFWGLNETLSTDTDYEFAIGASNGASLTLTGFTCDPDTTCNGNGVIAFQRASNAASTATLTGGGIVPGTQSFDYNIEVAVPEPATLMMIGAGLGLFGLARRRRR